MTSDGFSRKVALVAGGGGGFGSAIAEGLAAKGATVVLVGRQPDSIERVANSITAAGGEAAAISGDVTSSGDVSRIYDEVRNRFGDPSIVIDAAAVGGPFGPIGEFEPEQWWDAMALHIKASLLLMHHALPSMLSRSEGHVILLSSIVGQMIYPHLSAYSIGKAAQMSLVAHAASEHRNSGVCFFAIQPGFAYTKMTEETLESQEFQRWAPEATMRIRQFAKSNDDKASFLACAERCAQLASGRYDLLSGRFLKPEDDLDQEVTRVSADGKG